MKLPRPPLGIQRQVMLRVGNRTTSDAAASISTGRSAARILIAWRKSRFAGPTLQLLVAQGAQDRGRRSSAFGGLRRRACGCGPRRAILDQPALCETVAFGQIGGVAQVQQHAQDMAADATWPGKNRRISTAVPGVDGGVGNLDPDAAFLHGQDRRRRRLQVLLCPAQQATVRQRDKGLVVDGLQQAPQSSQERMRPSHSASLWGVNAATSAPTATHRSAICRS